MTTPAKAEEMAEEAKKAEAFAGEPVAAIPYFHGYYATKTGKVISMKRTQPIFLSQQPTWDGYLNVAMFKGNRSRTVSTRVHRAVLSAWKPQDEWQIMQVNHIDGNRINNHVDNLEWCSVSENVRHTYNTGRRPRIPGSGSARLTHEQIKFIRKYAVFGHRGDFSWRALGRLFGVSARAVGRVATGESWKDIV